MWKRPNSIFLAALNYSQKTMDSYQKAYQGSLKDKIMVFEKDILPALMCAKKVYEYYINKEPCQFRISPHNVREINDVSEYIIDGSEPYIFLLVKSMKEIISCKDRYSLDILNSIISKIHKMNGEIKKINIVKDIAELINDYNNNPHMELNLPNFVKNQYNSNDRQISIVKMAYIISISALKLAINGIGIYSHSKVNFFGVELFPNAVDSSQSMFSCEKNRIISFSLQICKEIQILIEVPFEHIINYDELKSNKERRFQYYKYLSESFCNKIDDLNHEYDDILTDLLNIIDSMASQINKHMKHINQLNGIEKVNKFLSIIPAEVMSIARKTYNFDKKYERLKLLKSRIEYCKKREGLVDWINQVFKFEIDDNILGIEVEMNQTVKLTSISVDILSL